MRAIDERARLQTTSDDPHSTIKSRRCHDFDAPQKIEMTLANVTYVVSARESPILLIKNARSQELAGR